MDQFRTPVTIPVSGFKIGYDTPGMLLGSCFSDYIGKIMQQHKLPVLLNPFGTLFNPLSIADSIDKLIAGKLTALEELKFYNGLWFSISHYTGFSHADRNTCLNQINTSEKEASAWLKNCHFLIITFGTAWVYTLKENGSVAANCHKLPGDTFDRVFAEPQIIIRRYENLIRLLQQNHPQIRIIFTVSPVRHWKDGAVNNQLSKSVLHWSIHEIMKRCPQTAYFPSYEIFMDELRDYRFYAGDMLHPSETATQYVWERFCDTYTSPETRKIMIEVLSVIKAANHRPVNVSDPGFIKFKQNTLQKIKQLESTYPFLNFSAEKAMLA